MSTLLPVLEQTGCVRSRLRQVVLIAMLPTLTVVSPALSSELLGHSPAALMLEHVNRRLEVVSPDRAGVGAPIPGESDALPETATPERAGYGAPPETVVHKQEETGVPSQHGANAPPAIAARERAGYGAPALEETDKLSEVAVHDPALAGASISSEADTLLGIVVHEGEDARDLDFARIHKALRGTGACPRRTLANR